MTEPDADARGADARWFGALPRPIREWLRADVLPLAEAYAAEYPGASDEELLEHLAAARQSLRAVLRAIAREHPELWEMRALARGGARPARTPPTRR